MKDRLTLFVHGLGGAGESTWRAAGHLGFPELVRGDTALQSETDFAFFEYPTSLFRLPFSSRAPRVRDLAEGLRTQIELRYSHYKTIVLVCHSLGGLVARKYLLEEAKRGLPLRVDKLLLFAVPNHGAALASVARFISWRHAQLTQLCRSSELVEDLNADWNALDMSNRIEVRYVVAGQDRVVDKQSAINQWGEKNVDSILDADHISVVKPRARRDLTYLILRRFVLGPAPVFMSVGGGRTSAQDAFVMAIKQYCVAHGVSASPVDEYCSTNKQPLKDVEQRMNRCYGAIVLAFERTLIKQGISRPGAGVELEKPLENIRLAPVWNQIESAMAYTRGLPLLVLVENGVLDDGMLESRYDWRVKRVDLSESVVEDPEFQGMFEDWLTSVLAGRDKSIYDA